MCYDQPRRHIKKQRHYFVNKGPSSQGYGFSSSRVWIESWTVKKAECRRIDAFELWCWRRLWRVLWTARRSNQSILKEISPGCSLEGLMLKLKRQYFGHLMRRVDSFEKTLIREFWYGKQYGHICMTGSALGSRRGKTVSRGRVESGKPSRRLLQQTPENQSVPKSGWVLKLSRKPFKIQILETCHEFSDSIWVTRRMCSQARCRILLARWEAIRKQQWGWERLMRYLSNRINTF